MKTHDFSYSNYEVLTKEDSATIRGGIVWTWAYFGLTVFLIPVITNPQAHIDAFMQGVNEGYNAVRVQ